MALPNIHNRMLPHPGSDSSPKSLNHRSLILFKSNNTMAWSNRLKNDNTPQRFSQSTRVAGLCPHRPAEEILSALRSRVGSPSQRTQPSLFIMSCGRECGVSDKTPCCFLVRRAVYRSYTQICSICKGWREEEVVNSLEVRFPLPF